MIGSADATRLRMTTHANTPNGGFVIAKTNSGNRKIGKVATTYVSQESCPTSCPFFDGGGCYAEQGPVGWITSRLNAAAKAAPTPPTPEELGQAEADAIDGLKVVPGQPLRLHTVGDCKTDEAASLVAAAAGRYQDEDRRGGPVWTYTHAWKNVSRDSWGEVSVLASCETADDVRAAHTRGYATSIVVEDFPTDKRYELDGIEILPCVQQTHGKTCDECRLCFDDERLLKKKLTIGFKVHGTNSGVRKAKLALQNPSNPNRKLSSRVLIPRFVAAFVSKHGRQPTTREIATALNLTTSSVSQMRKKLRQAGLLP